MENPDGKMENIKNDIRKTYEQFKKLERKVKWKNVKIKKDTYEEIKKLSQALRIPACEVIDLSITTLQILLHDRIKMPREVVERLGLEKCEDVHDAWYSYLFPNCVLHEYVLNYFKDRLRVQVLLKNLRKMAAEERKQVQS